MIWRSKCQKHFDVINCGKCLDPSVSIGRATGYLSKGCRFKCHCLNILILYSLHNNPAYFACEKIKSQSTTTTVIRRGFSLCMAIDSLKENPLEIVFSDNAILLMSLFNWQGIATSSLKSKRHFLIQHSGK